VSIDTLALLTGLVIALSLTLAVRNNPFLAFFVWIPLLLLWVLFV